MKQLHFFETEHIAIEAPCKPGKLSERDRLEQKYASQLREELDLGNQVSYVSNKKLPVLRLYRYKEAFAFRFVEEFIGRFGLDDSDYIFDPFAGMGTTLYAAAHNNISSIGVDRLPIGVFVARTLPLFDLLEPGQLTKIFEKLKKEFHRAKPADVAMDVAIMKVAFSPESLLTLKKWKTIIEGIEPPHKDILLLLFLSILEPCSYTSKDGQFLRLIRDKTVANPEDALEGKILSHLL